MSAPKNLTVTLEQGALALEEGAISANGEFQFSFNGRQDRIYHVEASDDLIKWTLLRTYVNPVRTVSFSDPETPSHSQRFYRLIEVTQ